MKRLLSIMFALIVLSAHAQTQTECELGKHQVHVSIGAFSTNMWISVFDNLLTDVISSDEFEQGSWSGAITAGYLYNFNKHLAVGGDVIYEHSISKGKQYNSKDNLYYLTVMPTMRLYWFNTKYVGMYSKAGLGLSTTVFDWDLREDIDEKVRDTSVEVKSRLAYQFTPVALEAGTQKIRGFAEIGYGDEGTFIAGLRYSF